LVSTRIAVIGDIHHGRDTPTKKGSVALSLLDRFIDEISSGHFDAVVELGDRISDESPDRDRVLQKEVADRFNQLSIPHHHLSGNHDVALLSLADNEAILGRPSGSRSVVIGGVRCVFWQPDVSLTPERGLHLAPGDHDALVRLLAEDDRPTLLVSHVPLSGQSQRGNYYFERNPGHASYAEVDTIRTAIAEAPCPIVALAGHVHWNTLTTVDGTPHLTLQSLTETFISGKPAEAIGALEIRGEVLNWTVTGREPLSVVLPWPKTKARWRAPLSRLTSSAA